MKKFIILLSFVCISILLVITPADTNASNMLQTAPTCTPDAAGGGCPTATEPPRETETSVPTAAATNTPAPTVAATNTPIPTESRATNTPLPPTITNTPEIREATTTSTPFPITLPTATATPFPINSNDDPLFDPPRPTPGLDLAYPTPTLTPFPLAGPEPNDLEIWAMEVTQGMQNLDNEMPLVADRLTVVRVYVRTDAGVTGGVRGFLASFRNGVQVGDTISSENQPISANASGGERVNLDDSLYFYLPESWVKKGDVTFKAFVYAGVIASVANEPNPDNNYFEVDVTIDDPLFFELNVINMHNHKYISQVKQGEADFDYIYTGIGGSANVVNNAYRFMPITTLNVKDAPAFILRPIGHVSAPEHSGDWDLTSPNNGKEAEKARLTQFKFLEDVNNINELAILNPDEPFKFGFGSGQYYGMINPTLQICRWKDGAVETCGIGGSSDGKTAIGRMIDTFSPTTPWVHSGGATLMHELGHSLGLGHYDCAGTEASGGGIDANAPFNSANCSLAPVETDGYYGFDVYWASFSNTIGPTVISNDPAATAPNQGFPLMSYKNSLYADPYSYCFMLNRLGVDCSPLSPWASLPSNGTVTVLPKRIDAFRMVQQEDPEYIFLTGYVDTFEGNADFYSIMRVPNATDNVLAMEAQNEEALAHAIEDDALTGYQLAFVDANGEMLATHDLFDQSSSHEEADTFSFVIVAPFLEETAVIHIINPDGEIIVTRTVSAPPTVNITSPSESVDTLPIEIRWEASDPDGGTLTYNLLYSANDGASWSIVAMDLTANAVTLESFAGMAGSNAGMFRVMAMDGINTATADTGAVVVVPDSAPRLTFSSPSVNRVYPLNGTVIFTGGANDLEDGALDSEAIAWASDVDGELGNGSPLILNNLSAGLHEITLTAVDSAGNIAELVSYITIDPAVTVERLSGEEMALGTDALNGILPQATTSNEAETEVTAEIVTSPTETAPYSISVEGATSDKEPSFAPWIGGGLFAALLAMLFFWIRRKT